MTSTTMVQDLCIADFIKVIFLHKDDPKPHNNAKRSFPLERIGKIVAEVWHLLSASSNSRYLAVYSNLK